MKLMNKIYLSASYKSLLTVTLFVLGNTLSFATNPCWGQNEEATVDKLIEDLGDGDDVVRREAVFELNQRGAVAKKAIPQLIELLSDDDDQVFHFTTQILANLGPDSVDAFDALVREMDDS